MVLLISYDLNRHERPASYAAVQAVIEQAALATIRPLYSQWFVHTHDSPETWSNRLLRVMDADDSLFVVQVRRPYQGWLRRSVWDWLDARI